MALVKRKASPYWWLDITVPAELVSRIGTTRIRESTNTLDRRLAQRLHDKRKHELWSMHKLGIQPDTTLTQAVRQWELHAKQKGLRSAGDVMQRLEWWKAKLGPDRPLKAISRRDIMSAVEGKQTIPKNKVEKPRPATPATINRYLQSIRVLLRWSVREELLEQAPAITLLTEPKGRTRTIGPAQIEKLLAALPEHLRDPLMFSLATGLRQSNAVQLQWSQVDLERRRLLVGADAFKNGEDFGIPLSETALAILARNKGHDEAVFTFEGRPLLAIQHRTWKAALKRAGIANFRWHDLRHTWATMLIEQGVGLDEVQQLGGWKRREMVLRYAHFRTEYLRKSASAIDKGLGGLGVTPTPATTAHPGHITSPG
jgi:integrase